MISYIVRMRFTQEHRADVVEAVRRLALASRTEPGCVSFIPHELAGDSGMLVIYEQYRDEAALEAHRASPHFREHVIGGLYQWMKERSVEDLNALA